MDNFNINDYKYTANKKTSDEFDKWDIKIKELFGDDAYIRKAITIDGMPIYKVYARYYPDAILSVKGKGETIKDAVNQAILVIERYRVGDFY